MVAPEVLKNLFSKIVPSLLIFRDEAEVSLDKIYVF